MKLTTVNAAMERDVSEHGSEGVQTVRLLLHRRDDGCSVSLIEFRAGGKLGMHPAGWPQLLVVVSGEGWVREGEGSRRQVKVGAAAFWDQGEPHESGTEVGMTAVIIEAPDSDDASVFGQQLASI
jgi:quercetin dioxygenase-like cupin family protein